MKENLKTGTCIVAVVGAFALLLVMSAFPRIERTGSVPRVTGKNPFGVLSVQAQTDDPPCSDCCTDTCSPPANGCCYACGKAHCDRSGPGGSNPPQPTHPPSEPGDPDPEPGDPDDPPPATAVSGGGGGSAICGNGWCEGGENCVTCNYDCGGCYPTATPRPWDAGEEVVYHCTPWGACPDGWADTTVIYNYLTGGFIVVDVVCLPESACVAPTRVPGVTPTPDDNGPCDYPPTIDGGIIHQPCEEWPGWYVDVELLIPPAAVLRNPWPRCLVGVPTQFWYKGATDVEAFSEEKALACAGVDYGRHYEESTYDCGGEVGAVGEGAKVNYQVGVAWRQWRSGDDPVFGYTPMGESVWTVHDRAWNGGDQVFVGPSVTYVFETSSWIPDPDEPLPEYCETHDCFSGMTELGPRWNPECQERVCDCDERVLDYLDSPSYLVNLETFWYPEWTWRYDKYYCADMDWGSCGCYGGGEPHGATQECQRPPGICNQPGEWYGKTGHCDYWQWKRVTEPWEKYSLIEMGFPHPLYPSTNVGVAGANPDGTRCGSFTDAWPCYIPVPCIEIQPEGVGWTD